MLIALVPYVIRRLSNSLGPTERIRHRTLGCKWSLLKVRERKIQRGAWWDSGGIWRPKEHASFPRVLLKTMLT
jgi:hypothetical protein